VVTGGARRIGVHIALFLAGKGFDIALHYNRSLDDARNAAREIEKTGRQCSLFRADLSSAGQVTDLSREIIDSGTDCAVLINNASVFRRAHLLETGTDLLKDMFSINLYAPVILMREFAKHAQDTGRPLHIINLLDTKITQNHTPYFGYSLTKKALADATVMAARDLGPLVRVNGISPGLILPSADSGLEGFNRMKKDLPLRMAGDPSYITKAVEFLLDNPFITGEILFIDGGEHTNR